MTNDKLVEEVKSKASKLRCSKCGKGFTGIGSLQSKIVNGELVHLRCPEDEKLVEQCLQLMKTYNLPNDDSMHDRIVDTYRGDYLRQIFPIIILKEGYKQGVEAHHKTCKMDYDAGVADTKQILQGKYQAQITHLGGTHREITEKLVGEAREATQREMIKEIEKRASFHSDEELSYVRLSWNDWQALKSGTWKEKK